MNKLLLTALTTASACMLMPVAMADNGNHNGNNAQNVQYPAVQYQTRDSNDRYDNHRDHQNDGKNPQWQTQHTQPNTQQGQWQNVVRQDQRNNNQRNTNHRNNNQRSNNNWQQHDDSQQNDRWHNNHWNNNDNDRNQNARYHNQAYQQYPNAYHNGYNQLPPGLQKNVARGKAIPPGWAKKLHANEYHVIRQNGQDVYILDPDVYRRATIISRPRTGVVQLRIDDRTLEVIELTRAIVSILN